MTENFTTTSSSAASQAADAVAQADAVANRLAKEVVGVRVAIAAYACASLAGLLIMGLAPAPGGIIGGTAFLMGAAIMLGVIGASAKARPVGFNRRYLTMIAAWAVIYTAVVTLGLTAFDGSTVFWIIGAFLSTIPGFWFLLAKSER